MASTASFVISPCSIRILVFPSNVDHPTRWALLQNRPKNEVHDRRDAGKEQRHQRHDPPQAGHVEIELVRQPSAHARNHLLVATSVQIAHAEYYTPPSIDRKSTRLNSSHQIISYAVFCL